MREVVIGDIGIRTSCIGLGCGRIVGRLTLRESRRLVETALDLGIRHFDTAPSYGMGTSEEVLGDVLAGVPGTTITTKIGPGRGVYSPRVNVVRKFVKPVLDRFARIKRLARRSYAAKPTVAAARPRYDFSSERIRRELETSLRLLRRTSVDLLLAHEPHQDDLSPALTDVFRNLRTSGLIRGWGTGIDARSAPWLDFGQVWQSGWPGPDVAYPPGPSYFFHGVLRYGKRDERGRFAVPPGEMLRRAADSRPGCVLIVSAANPRRLRELFKD
jgi:aryl-alcohol dehydrogenase-like predicted oxidoreductase